MAELDKLRSIITSKNTEIGELYARGKDLERKVHEREVEKVTLNEANSRLKVEVDEQDAHKEIYRERVKELEEKY